MPGVYIEINEILIQLDDNENQVAELYSIGISLIKLEIIKSLFYT